MPKKPPVTKTFIRKVEAVEAVQWDGSNGQQIVASLPEGNAGAVSPDGESLVLWQLDRWVSPPQNSWIVTTGTVVVAMPDEEFQKAFEAQA